MLAGDLGALTQRHETVTTADQHRLETRFLTQQAMQLPGDGQRDLLFTDPARSQRARIVTAMPGIDRDHQISPFVVELLHRFDVGRHCGHPR